MLELLLGDIENHVAEHLDEAAIGIIGKTRIIAEFGQGFDGLIVEAEVEDGIHHAGHGELGAGADGDEEGIVARAELLALQLFKLLEGGVHLGIDLWTDGAAHVLATGLGLDGESGRDGQAGVGHLGQACALAAQYILHFAVSVGLSAAEEITIFDWG